MIIKENCIAEPRLGYILRTSLISSAQDEIKIFYIKKNIFYEKYKMNGRNVITGPVAATTHQCMTTFIFIALF